MLLPLFYLFLSLNYLDRCILSDYYCIIPFPNTSIRLLPAFVTIQGTVVQLHKYKISPTFTRKLRV